MGKFTLNLILATSFCFFSSVALAQKKKPARTVAVQDDGSTEYPRFTYDLGAAVGSNGTTNYTEINLGLNTFFSSWLNWRNALFGRFGSNISNVYGWDTGARAGGGIDLEVIALQVFAGGGYRFVTTGSSAPFAEAGLQFSLAGLRLGGGVKTVLHSAVQSGAPNDTQYFLILSGSGQL